MFWWIVLGGAAVLALRKKEEIVALANRVSGRDDELQASLAVSLPAAALPYIPLAFEVGYDASVDPLLLLAIMARESAYGEALKPVGPGGTGDAGHGRGLMQIDDRSWREWIDANPWWEPRTNIAKGAAILKTNLRFFAGRGTVPGVTDGLLVTVSQAHASRRRVEAGVYPDPRPLEGEELRRAALAAYNTGAANVLISLAAGLGPDTTTTGGNYAGWVASRADELSQEGSA